MSEIEEFEEKVEVYTEAIKKICRGEEIDFAQFEAREEMEKKIKDMKKRDMEEKKKRAELQGIPGKGEKDNYDFFCKRCFLEFDAKKFEKNQNLCSQCRTSDRILTRDERKLEIDELVEKYKEEQRDHVTKKDRFVKW